MPHMQIWKEVQRRKIRGQTVLTLVRAWTGTIGLELAVKMGVASVQDGSAAGREAAEGRAEASDCDVGAG